MTLVLCRDRHFGDVRTNDIMVKQDLSFNDRYIVARNFNWEASSY